MKKVLLLAVALGLLMGCGHSAVQSEFKQHDAMYQNWDHMKFSMFGYKNVTAQDVKNAKEQGWWGIDIPHTPEK